MLLTSVKIKLGEPPTLYIEGTTSKLLDICTGIENWFEQNPDGLVKIVEMEHPDDTKNIYQKLGKVFDEFRLSNIKIISQNFTFNASVERDQREKEIGNEQLKFVSQQLRPKGRSLLGSKDPVSNGL